jgi:translation initiation factor 2 gamma subunit (eIF-2gamma)
MALEISGIEKVIVVQNKIDLVSKERAVRNYQQIKDFLKGEQVRRCAYRANQCPARRQHRRAHQTDARRLHCA